MEPIPVEFMHGRWKGFEIETGHPLGGLLVPAGWYGKVFLDNEEVHPIVFFGKDKTELYSVNPKLVPFEMKVPKDERLKKMISIVRVVLETTESKARLRPLGYRGKVSATMIYDEIPLIDIFVKIDERRVFGVADMKGQPPLFLVMERDDETKLALAALTAAVTRSLIYCSGCPDGASCPPRRHHVALTAWSCPLSRRMVDKRREGRAYSGHKTSVKTLYVRAWFYISSVLTTRRQRDRPPPAALNPPGAAQATNFRLGRSVVGALSTVMVRTLGTSWGSIRPRTSVRNAPPFFMPTMTSGFSAATFSAILRRAA